MHQKAALIWLVNFAKRKTAPIKKQSSLGDKELFMVYDKPHHTKKELFVDCIENKFVFFLCGYASLCQRSPSKKLIIFFRYVIYSKTRSNVKFKMANILDF